MSSNDSRRVQREARRIVIKVGSSTLTEKGLLRDEKFTDLARQVSALFEDGRQIVVVSSGAIAAGSHQLGWSHFGRSIPEKQAAAAVGQIALVELYKQRFAEHGRHVGQLLLTRAGLEHRERFLNARHTLTELLALGVVPIVNENDTVATDEIRFGDNDNLSASIVNLVNADLLIILTDVAGLFRRPPEAGRPEPELFDVVEKITPEIESCAQGSGNVFGRGGMITKLEAAKIAARSGAATLLCDGHETNVLTRVLSGEALGTLFLAGDKLSSRKHWLAFTNREKGELHIDEGAVRAIRERGRSLLPAGLLRVAGSFTRGDVVGCFGPDGTLVARGLVSYDAEESGRIAGMKAREIEPVLGYSNGDAIIHRDDLVVLED
jgi:glutamate 5-kinase